ncbi:MAG: addiction module protein [Reichenbachiella sp.]|uniref:addiction module protein n=1 Tax=Reichenbachiella sp. TaxID=2184521 RepID=UPI003267D730
MSRVDLRDEIHQYIDKADDRILQLIYGMMQADLSEEDYELSEAHKQVLDERLTAHKSNPQTGSNWKEAKERISNQL